MHRRMLVEELAHRPLALAATARSAYPTSASMNGNLSYRTGMEDKYNFHLLRHAAASLFIAYLNWTPKRIQTVMGHSSVQMTFDLYGHLFEDKEADREAMAKLEAAVRVA